MHAEIKLFDIGSSARLLLIRRLESQLIEWKREALNGVKAHHTSQRQTVVVMMDKQTGQVVLGSIQIKDGHVSHKAGD